MYEVVWFRLQLLLYRRRMAVYRPGLGREAPRDAQQNAIDIVAGLTPAANRIGLKQVFQKYGDVIAASQ